NCQFPARVALGESVELLPPPQAESIIMPASSKIHRLFVYPGESGSGWVGRRIGSLVNGPLVNFCMMFFVLEGSSASVGQWLHRMCARVDERQQWGKTCCRNALRAENEFWNGGRGGVDPAGDGQIKDGIVSGAVHR